MFEWVPGIFALLCAVENQSHQVPVTTNDLTGVHTAHNLHGEKTAIIIIIIRHRAMRSRYNTDMH